MKTEIKGIVKYWDLGGNKAKGLIKITAKNEEDFNQQMEKEFSKHLMSCDISFTDGNIIVGGFRTVGKFEFIAQVFDD